MPVMAETAKEWNAEGVKLYKEGKYEDALKCFEKASKLNSKNVTYWTNFGLTYMALKKTDEAMYCYTNAFLADMDNPKPWHLAGKCLYSTGKYKEALNMFNKVLEIDPKYKFDKESENMIKNLKSLTNNYELTEDDVNKSLSNFAFKFMSDKGSFGNNGDWQAYDGKWYNDENYGKAYHTKAKYVIANHKKNVSYAWNLDIYIYYDESDKLIHTINKSNDKPIETTLTGENQTSNNNSNNNSENNGETLTNNNKPNISASKSKCMNCQKYLVFLYKTTEDWINPDTGYLSILAGSSIYECPNCKKKGSKYLYCARPMPNNQIILYPDRVPDSFYKKN